MRAIILLLSVFWGLNAAIAEEGFYRPEQLGADALFLQNAQGATVLFDSRGSDGVWTPFANGFFVSKNGHILTNHHVGTNCGGRNPSGDYQDRSHPREYPAGHGYPCSDFRARVFPNTAREVILNLEMIARPSQAVLDAGGDFMILRATNYQPHHYIGIAKTRDFPIGTPYYMLGYPPVTTRGNSSALIRNGVYSDVGYRGDYRISYGEIVPAPDDYLNASNPVPYFVGNGDGAPGTSGSLLLTPGGNFLGYVQGYADRRGIPGSPLCIRDGIPAGPAQFFCGGLENFQRATWIIDRLNDTFQSTVRDILLANLAQKKKAS